jgi:SAM-dependent methyltransferase
VSGTFDHYAAYYDLLYADKPYAEEADFVAGLVRGAAPAARTVLELGCGTAAHAVELARRGFTVSGVDLSPGMIEGARERISRTGAAGVEVAVGDVRTVRLGRRFDAVVSLFHVVSYQTTNADLAATFQTAADHLDPGGAFLFDVWYGPAVLTDQPSVRVKRMSDARIDVLRLAEPVLHANTNVVDVNFTVLITDRGTGVVRELKEQHPMRYCFLPELEGALDVAGFRLERACEWLTGNALSVSTWNATVVAVKG